jgi:uncharacterized membrane protein SirB2
MSSIDDVFNTLLFGSGSWIGLLIIVVFIIVLSGATKIVGKVISVPICTFLGIEYLSKTNETPHLAWHSLIMFLMVIFIVYSLLDEQRKKR